MKSKSRHRDTGFQHSGCILEGQINIDICFLPFYVCQAYTHLFASYLSYQTGRAVATRGGGRGRTGGVGITNGSSGTMTTSPSLMVFVSGRFVRKTLQVVGHLVASRDEQIEVGFLDGVQARAAGEEDTVGGAVDLSSMSV
jgi:hypothetical protein